MTVDHRGNLPVGAAGVEADAAAVQVAPHGGGGLSDLGAVLQGQIQDLQLLLVKLIEEGAVKIPLPAGGIGLLQPPGQLRAAAYRYPETAGGPQQKFHIPLHIPVIRLRHLGRAVDKGVVYRNLPLVPLHRNGNRHLGVLEVSLPPNSEGNERRIQLRGMLH